MTEEKGRSLSRHEFDAVIRRAAELASSDSDLSESALTETELFRIAREVGLSERHVRTALTEVRSQQTVGGAMDRIFGPVFLRAMRVVPGTPKELHDQLDDFFVGTQLLQPVRRGPLMLQYRPAVDWASQIARAASFTSRKYYVASAKSVEIHLEEVEDKRTLVELVVEPGTRSDAVAGASAGGGLVGVGMGIAAGASLAAVAPILVASGVGILAGGGLASVIAYAVGTNHKKKLLQVQSELEGILDRLELGETLEPPPASWRRWVKRQFHGVARDLMRDERDEKDTAG